MTQGEQTKTMKAIVLAALLFLTPPGCTTARAPARTAPTQQLRQRAMQCLKAGIRYPHNAVVRAEAVEAMESGDRKQTLPWIRTALLDEHPAVRFAACIAIGNARDGVADAAVAKRLSDEHASVRVAALYARHRLGHSDRTGTIITYLLEHKDPAVRRNAALVLGLLGETSAIKVLARAIRDADAGVRQHALEAMARLGNSEARQELTFMTSAGVGSDEVFAINALAATRDTRYVDTFRYKLATAIHLETRLAAARGLGLMGIDEGYDVAMRALGRTRPMFKDTEDPPAGQVLRAKQLSASALGAIGRRSALGALVKQMDFEKDPRIRLSAARAVLDILGARQPDANPFAPVTKGH